MKDYLVRGLVNSKNCRVFACRTTNLVDVARKIIIYGLLPQLRLEE